MDIISAIQYTGVLGKYVPRTAGGGGTSVLASAAGDASKVVGFNSAMPMIGGVQTPNSTDNAYYFCPLGVVEATATGIVRGRFRGIYHVCHPLASFTDGQVITGAGDFAGKTFQIVSKGINAGYWAIETSATLETN